MRLLATLLIACAPPPTVPPPAASPAASEVAYDAVLAGIEADRIALAAQLEARPGQEAAVIDEARTRVLDAIADDLFPRWTGTPWAFYGTTQTPGQGTIACGYYVSTILRDAGFEVERVSLAQQASERIIQTLVPPDGIRRFSDAPASRVVASVRDQGEGLFLLGLDFHAAFLLHRAGTVQMCHASYLGTGGVVCEDALTSEAMVSRYRVTGKLFDDAMMRGWLEGRAFPTRR